MANKGAITMAATGSNTKFFNLSKSYSSPLASN